jgi:dinuclear metal center YbgI/SA1388 family protein
MHRDALEAHLNQYLNAAAFRDYCPNGLQVEGREEVRCVVTGVTASAALIEAAIAARADAILVHHGYFWRGEDARITGMRRRRVGLLVEHGINLYAYHLPLDAHPECGNNAALARELGLTVEGRFGEQDIACHGRLATPMTLAQFALLVRQRLAREAMVIGDSAREVSRIAWCTGAAQGFIEAALPLRADVYLTGEASEQTVHVARECGIAFIAAGHHATERYGVQALGEHLASACGLEHHFIDIPNPV